MNNITAAYRHHGAVLEMSRRDAYTLIARGVGIMDPAFNTESGLLGVRVPGGKIDRLVPGESPRLFLVGGIEIARDDYCGDSITSIKSINIDGLFDEEEA